MPSATRNFAITPWTVVLTAGNGTTVAAKNALEVLCSTYWYPLYVYVRRRGHSIDEAQDLTQEFFAHFLEKNYLEQVDPGNGRFRAYLLACLNHFLANEWERRTALKRGGGLPAFPLDLSKAERRYDLEPASTLTPEKIFERRWALTVLDHVLTRLRAEFADKGKESLFDALKFSLTGDPTVEAYAAAVAATKMNDGALKTAVHRLKRRYKALLKKEVARTVDGPAEIEDELRHLFKALAKD